MSRIPHALASLVLVVVAVVSPAATTVTSTSLVSVSTLAIDGTVCDRLVNWSGGDLRGSVVALPSTSGVATKMLGQTAVAPLVVQVALPLSPRLASLVNELCSAHFARHTVLITDCNSLGVATDAFELTNAMLSEVTFPAFDATTSIGPMKLVFNGERSSAVSASATRSLATQKSAATFQLAIEGLDGSGVMRIEPLTVRRRLSSDTIGQARVSKVTPSGTEFSNLLVTLSTAKAASWKSWWTDFVLKGLAADANEKRGSLTLIDLSGRPLNFPFNFRQLGILRVSRPPGTAGVASKIEAELYFEGLSVSVPSSSDPTDSSGPTSSDADRTPGTTEDPLSSSPTAKNANSADLGSRDPAEFPRVDGLTRTSYSGTYQPTYTSEQASYTSGDTLSQLVARVDAAAKAAGWTLGTLREAGTSSDKTVIESWTKPSATAGVSFLESTTASGTRLELKVYIQLPEPK